MISSRKLSMILALASLSVRGQSPVPRPATAAASAERLKPLGQTYDPPPPPPDPFDDVPWPDDPPDVWTDPFDPITDLPDPIDLPWPDEDPFDDPINDLPVPFPDPPGLEDPFPDSPSLFDGEPLGYADVPAPVALAPAPNAASNSPVKLMPFPMRIPFHPVYSGTAAPRTPRKCDAAFATTLAIPESKSNTLYIVNTCSRSHFRIPVGNHPAGVAATPDGRFFFVTNIGASNISVVDIAAQTTAATIVLPASSGGQPAQPSAIVITPDGTRAYVTNHDDLPGSVVYVIDVPNRKFLSTIPVGAFPASIAITPDGSQVWVPSRGDSNITVIDTLTNTPTVTIGKVTLATGIAFNPTGTRAYAAEGVETGGAILVIDTSSYSTLATIPVGNLPHAVAVTPSGHYVFVTNALSNYVSMIDANTNTVIRKLTVGQHALGLAFIH